MAGHAFFPPLRGVDFTAPAGAAALFAPSSIAWQVYKNPVALFIGGVTAVLLELAEPRVRTGVWEHTTFRTDPLGRMRRTAAAAMTTVYAPRADAVRLIARVSAMHAQVTGATPAGVPYRADDPELLDWVHATAAFGFLTAYHRFVRPLPAPARDRFFAEGGEAAALYGAVQSPASESAWEALLARMAPQLEPHPIVFEFLSIVDRVAAAPAPLRPLQRLFVRAAVSLVPGPVRDKLGLDRRWAMPAGGATVVRAVGRIADRVVLREAPPAHACVRMGLNADYLHR